MEYFERTAVRRGRARGLHCVHLRGHGLILPYKLEILESFADRLVLLTLTLSGQQGVYPFPVYAVDLLMKRK